MGCGVSASSSRTMTSLPLPEQDRFWVERVRSMSPGLAFRFRAFISVTGWNTASLMRSASFLPLEACGPVPRPSCTPSAAVRNQEWGGLAVGRYRLQEKTNGGNEPHALRWIKDEDITLPVLLNFVSNHRPRVSRVLEDHRHKFCRSHRPTQRIVYGPGASLTRGKVVRDPPHCLLSSGVFPVVRGGGNRDCPGDTPALSERKSTSSHLDVGE